MKILITGGAGFVGFNLACKLKNKYPEYKITVVDNLVRRGSEINLPTLKKNGIDFIHADIRVESDLQGLSPVDLIVDASADPSILSGIISSTVKVLQSNLFATVNLLEMAVRHKAKFIFLSTSRVYPIEKLNRLEIEETATRFRLRDIQIIPGVSKNGISELFPLDGSRSFYGAAKLSSEILIQEYISLKGLEASILRCGVIAGPGQFGKVDQGVLVFWLANHIWNREFAYFGFGGKGKQVRDFLHIDDLFLLVELQLDKFNLFTGKTYNVGGGDKNSLSLNELTTLCQSVTGNKVFINEQLDNRPADIPYYVSDNEVISRATGWSPKKDNLELVKDTFEWFKTNEFKLKEILL